MKKGINLLLLFMPMSLFFHYYYEGSIWVFVTASLAIIPLAAKMTCITDKIANFIGPAHGGLLNVTFGNATELIISFFAILNGLLNVVKAAITGSILMNLLLVLGLSFFVGGLKHRTQKFDRLIAITNSTMLMLAVIAMLIPAIFYFASSNIKTIILGRLSIGVGLILFATYLSSLYFTLVIHENELERKSTHNVYKENENVFILIIMLLLSTSLIALEANILVGSINNISEKLNVSPVFIGIIVLPIISNVAENYTAINMAHKDKIDLSINIAVGSSIQVALFLVPLLIFISHILGQPMNVLFNILEISSIALSVLAINIVYLQGKSNWFEGLQLCAAYFIIAIAFFYA